MSNNKNAPVVREQGALMPSYLANFDTSVFATDIGTEDITIPRLKLCQPMSTKAKEGNLNLREGEFYSSINFTSFGNEMKIILVDLYKSTVWFSDENKFLAQKLYLKGKETDVFGPYADIVKSNKEVFDKGADQINYWAVKLDDLKNAVINKSVPEFYLWSIGGLATTNARKVNAIIKINEGKKIPVFLNVFNVSVQKETTKKGIAYLPNFDLNAEEQLTAQDFEVLAKLWKEIQDIQKRDDFKNINAPVTGKEETVL